MKTTAGLAAMTAALVLVAGCSCLRHKEKLPREPVQLPGAPSLEPGPATSPVPNMSGPMPSPISQTAPVPATGRN